MKKRVVKHLNTLIITKRAAEVVRISEAFFYSEEMTKETLQSQDFVNEEKCRFLSSERSIYLEDQIFIQIILSDGTHTLSRA